MIAVKEERLGKGVCSEKWLLLSARPDKELDSEVRIAGLGSLISEPRRTGLDPEEMPERIASCFPLLACDLWCFLTPYLFALNQR